MNYGKCDRKLRKYFQFLYFSGQRDIIVEATLQFKKVSEREQMLNYQLKNTPRISNKTKKLPKN